MVKLQDSPIDCLCAGAAVAPSHGYPAVDEDPAPDAARPLIERLSASDAESASGAISEAYHDVTVHLDRKKKNLNLEIATCKLPNIRLGKLRISASTVCTSYYPLITVCLPVDGKVLISSNGSTVPLSDNSGAVVSSGSSVVVEYLTDESRIETLVFEEAAVEAELAGMLGEPVTEPLRFDSQLSVTAGSPLSRAVALMRHEMSGPGGLATIPTMSTRLGRLVMAGLLISQPHNYTEELTKPKTVQASKPIRNALEFIEGRPAEIETVADIAAAVGLSVRALDDGFQRYVGTPPMAFLRQVRMARAHDDLLAADPEVTTATAVARKWGFGHYGRFAADYRRRFGRKPSETLRSS